MEITQLHDEIFDFLFQKHLEARARGEEFYFLMEDIVKDKNEIALTFWKLKQQNVLYFPVLCLYMNVELNETTFIVRYPITVTLESKEHDSVLGEKYTLLEEKIKAALEFNENEDGLLSKTYKTDNILTFLTNFISKDKIAIDGIIKELKEDELWFIDKTTFLKDNLSIRGRKYVEVKNSTNERYLTLRSIQIFNYKSIKQVSINDIPPKTQWIFLTGENGYGKTLILEAISIGLFGKIEEENTLLINEKSYIETVYALNGALDVTFSDNFNGRGLCLYKEIARPCLLAYGSNRTFCDNNSKGTILPLFDTNMGLPFLQKEWYAIGLNDSPKTQQQFKILEDTLAEIGLYIEVDKNEECLFFSLLFDEDEYFSTVKFEALSAAYKNLFLLVGDIIYKFTKHKDNVNPSKDDLSGIVIIDEFELHLHPKMQRFLVEKLTELFPKVQFIVSTHSPIPLLGAPKESVILHVTRTKENGITVERLDDKIDFHTLLPEALLSSPIFDFDNFLRRNGQPFYKFSTENDYNEVVFDKMLEDKLAILAEKGGKTLADILKKKE